MKFWLCAFVFAYGVWLIHDDSGQVPELLTGILVAAVAATATELVRRQRLAQMAFHARDVRRAPRLLTASVRDSVALVRLAFAQLVRPEPVRGRTVSLPYEDSGDGAHANGRRALALGLGSFAPGTIVIGVDSDDGRLIAHQLGSSPAPSNVDPLELG